MLRVLKYALLLLIVVLVAGAGFAWWRTGVLETTDVKPNVWMLSGVGSNVTVVATSEGTIVVDSMALVQQGERIVERAQALTGTPVAVLINTHYHLDHTHGNPAFPIGTKVVSTDRTLEHLRTLDGRWWKDSPAKDLLPNYTFTDTWSARYGETTLRAIHPGRGHTDGDLVLLLVEERVLVAGDLFFNGYYPNIDLEAGGTVAGWPETLDAVLALDFDTVVPGHGPLATRADLERFRDFMRALAQQTAAVVARGGTLADAQREVDLEAFGLRRVPFAPFLSRSFVIERAYEEATRKPS
ncbi:MAG TPA: MBL fold metallo-hydrolase [Candidatus Limnocylindria bacterium]|nr:MBL fold metallo-hydrolase [Candidatus Limnocylindria bacterium]